MPEEAARQLREALPPRARRWQSSGASTFLKLIAEADDLYGARQCAAAMGVAESTIFDWLKRSVPHSGEVWPTQQELRELRRAWRVKVARRRSGRYITRNTSEYEDVHLALIELLKSYDIRVVAAAMGESKADLQKFRDLPVENADEREELDVLVTQVKKRIALQRELTGVQRVSARTVLSALATQIKVCNQYVSTAKIARRLKVSVASIETVLTEDRHEDAG